MLFKYLAYALKCLCRARCSSRTLFSLWLSLSLSHTHTNCNSMSIPKEWDDILSFCVSCHVRVAFQPNAYKKVRIACASGTLVPCQEQPATLITSCGAYNFCKYAWQIVHFKDTMTPTFYHQPKPTKNQTHNSENFAPIKKQTPTFSTNYAWKTKLIQISRTGKEKKKRRKTNKHTAKDSVKISSESKNLMNGVIKWASRKPR